MNWLFIGFPHWKLLIAYVFNPMKIIPIQYFFYYHMFAQETKYIAYNKIQIEILILVISLFCPSIIWVIESEILILHFLFVSWLIFLFFSLHKKVWCRAVLCSNGENNRYVNNEIVLSCAFFTPLVWCDFIYYGSQVLLIFSVFFQFT